MSAFDNSTKINSTNQDANDKHRIMLFDVEVRGHHAGYIQHLLNYWCKQKYTNHLDIVVSPKFLQQHSDVVKIGSASNQQNINFVSITPEEEASLGDIGSFTGRFRRAFQEWHLILNYTRLLAPDQCLLMYLDTVLLRLALGVGLPCPFSCIYFRPVFHYSDFASYSPSWRERIWQQRDQLFLSRLLSSPSLQTLFCLDPFAVEYINELKGRSVAVHISDPVQIYSDLKLEPEGLKRSLNIDHGRQVFLLFGALTERKGINQLLEAIELLPQHLCQRLCLLLVGPLDTQDNELTKTRITSIAQAMLVQIICRHKFVTDQEIQPYFVIADVVLAPYQRHVGMSAILVRAAAAQKPVLSSSYGLMGEVTRRYELGLTVESRTPNEIASGLTIFLSQPSANFYNPIKMKQLAKENSAERFAKTIFQHLL